MDKPLVSVNILIYDSRAHIERCLDSILAQSYPALEITLVINGNADHALELVQDKYGRHKNFNILEPGENLWFSHGHNYALKHSRGDYVLVLNDDTIMDREFIRTLVEALETDKTLGSVSGKLLHYDYSIDSRTKILDSTGIEMYKTRKVIDRGQWEKDRHQYDADTEIFGASGAAALYRRQALEEVKLPKLDGSFEYFDEDFIAYKDDIDLSWRLLLYGYRCRYVPRAVVYHGRTIGRSWPTRVINFILNRMRQPRNVRIQSFKNHYLMMVKNEIPRHFWRQLPYILGREILLWIYSLLFEQFQVIAIRDFFRQLPEARRKRRIVMSRAKVGYPKLLYLFD